MSSPAALNGRPLHRGHRGDRRRRHGGIGDIGSRWPRHGRRAPPSSCCRWGVLDGAPGRACRPAAREGGHSARRRHRLERPQRRARSARLLLDTVISGIQGPERELHAPSVELEQQGASSGRDCRCVRTTVHRPRPKMKKWSGPGHAAPSGSPVAFPPYPEPAGSSQRSSSCPCSVAPACSTCYVDWLWFGEVGFRSVFSTVLFTHVLLFVIGGLVTGGGRRAVAVDRLPARPVFVPVSGPRTHRALPPVMIQRLRLFGIGIPVHHRASSPASRCRATGRPSRCS